MEFTLERFKSAQEEAYDRALAEIRAGRKQSHWMWYIFPQIQGLGRSTLAQYYAIQDRAEALAYWRDPLLSARLREISRELLKLEGTAEEIMGFPDNLKLRSSMTLFWVVTGEPVFKEVLDKFFGGEPDGFTLEKLV